MRIDLVLGEEGLYIIFSFNIVLDFNLLVLTSERVSFSILFPQTVYNNKVVLS